MALLSEEEKQQLKQIMADYPNNEDLDLTCFSGSYGDFNNQLWFLYGSCYRNGVHEPKLYSDYGMFLWSGI